MPSVLTELLCVSDGRFRRYGAVLPVAGAITPDGVEVKAREMGAGPPIVVLHSGFDDGRAYRRVAGRLASKFRVVVPVRRQYRSDLPGPCSIDQEVAQVLALVAVLERPPVLYGHSSGGVVALEAVVAQPDLFRSLVVYEPPIAVDHPVGGAAAVAAIEAVRAGKHRLATLRFLRDIVGLHPAAAHVAATCAAATPLGRRLVQQQLADVSALDTLGHRLDAYRTLSIPVVLVGGDRSPERLVAGLDALAQAIPAARREVLRGSGHAAHLTAPSALSAVLGRSAYEARA